MYATLIQLQLQIAALHVFLGNHAVQRAAASAVSTNQWMIIEVQPIADENCHATEKKDTTAAYGDVVRCGVMW